MVAHGRASRGSRHSASTVAALRIGRACLPAGVDVRALHLELAVSCRSLAIHVGGHAQRVEHLRDGLPLARAEGNISARLHLAAAHRFVIRVGGVFERAAERLALEAVRVLHRADRDVARRRDGGVALRRDRRAQQRRIAARHHRHAALRVDRRAPMLAALGPAGGTTYVLATAAERVLQRRGADRRIPARRHLRVAAGAHPRALELRVALRHDAQRFVRVDRPWPVDERVRHGIGLPCTPGCLPDAARL
ncbi:hypothetical protein PTE30175_04709 [Pandoraea terrae]|uniref:Uncharacterized protein n=1 Tax=Pandoraea terrae TaxID=1537710 RepID=A0A5E4YWC5_9BURK|nr:hypothetical protein PTE30175_04709 [Pandoraea terrae]